LDQLLTIDVLGQPFSFKTDSEVSEARAIADYLAESVSQVKSQCGNQVPAPDKRAILILAALNITSEDFNLKKKHHDLLKDLNQRSEQLISTLEAQLRFDDAKTASP
jgi:cell division protein ZapA (FtsZ GTPase activity inhibitor)